MKIVKVNLEKINKSIIKEIVRVLKNGGMVVYPSDTCYGLAVDGSNKKAIDKVYRFKQRDKNKPLSVMVRDKNEFIKYGEWSPIVDKFLVKKKAYTYVVKRTKNLSKYLNSQNKNIGIQIPKNRLSQEILKYFPRPITATSANISNKKNVYNINFLLRQIKKENSKILPDLILDAGQIPYKKPSTIINILKNRYNILRK